MDKGRRGVDFARVRAGGPYKNPRGRHDDIHAAGLAQKPQAG